MAKRIKKERCRIRACPICLMLKSNRNTPMQFKEIKEEINVPKETYAEWLERWLTYEANKYGTYGEA